MTELNVQEFIDAMHGAEEWHTFNYPIREFLSNYLGAYTAGIDSAFGKLWEVQNATGKKKAIDCIEGAYDFNGLENAFEVSNPRLSVHANAGAWLKSEIYDVMKAYKQGWDDVTCAIARYDKFYITGIDVLPLTQLATQE